jgi:predicted transcriptional regulator
MGVMSVRVNDDKRKLLKVIASAEGKTISGIVEELIEDYIDKNKTKVLKFTQQDEQQELMKLSEAAFAADWDNEEDAIYDKL